MDKADRLRVVVISMTTLRTHEESKNVAASKGDETS